MEKEYIISEKQLLDLLKSQCRLTALECIGVDNWDGYDYQRELLDDWGVEDYPEAAEKLLQELLADNQISKLTCDCDNCEEN